MCMSTNSEFYDSENGYTYEKCKDCSSIYLNPRPNPEDRSKALEYGIHQGDTILKTTPPFSKKKVKEYKKIIAELDFIKQLREKAKILDLGAGNGEFLVVFQSLGFKNISAIEPNKNKQKELLKHSICLEESLKLNQKYDFISMLNVFSHLEDPKKTLNTIFSLLNEGGYLLIQTGDSSLCSAKEHYKPYLATDHLLFTHEKQLNNLLASLGFKKLKSLSKPSYYSRFLVKTLVKTLLGKTPMVNLTYASKHKDLWCLSRK